MALYLFDSKLLIIGESLAANINCCCEPPGYDCNFTPIEYPFTWDVALTNLVDAEGGCDATPEIQATHRLSSEGCSATTCQWGKREIPLADCELDMNIFMTAQCFTTEIELRVSVEFDELFPVPHAVWWDVFPLTTDFLAMAGQSLTLRNTAGFDDGDCAVTAI